jgi:hypothetical protein
MLSGKYTQISGNQASGRFFKWNMRGNFSNTLSIRYPRIWINIKTASNRSLIPLQPFRTANKFIPTPCHFIPTLCHFIPTTCHFIPTLCKMAPTLCMMAPTLCMMAPTLCMMAFTLCKHAFTSCIHIPTPCIRNFQV